MALELTVIGILIVMLGVHFWLGKMHSGRIRQFGKYIDEMNRSDVPDEMYEESLNCVRMHAQAKADRRSNRHVITVYAVCLTGLAIMSLLSIVELADAMGWTSLLVIPLPAYLSADHLRMAAHISNGSVIR